MAEAPALQLAPSGDTSKILCRYFMHGACHNGDGCRYSHSYADKPNLVCTYYLKGQCTYNETCRYDHVKDRSPNSLSAISSHNNIQLQSSSQFPALTSTAAESCKNHSNATAGLSPCSSSQVGVSSPSCFKFPVSQSTVLPASCHIGDVKSNWTTLSRNKDSAAVCSSGIKPEDWVRAPEFVPRFAWPAAASATQLDYVPDESSGYADIESASDCVEGYSYDDYNSLGAVGCSMAEVQNGDYAGPEYAGSTELCPYAMQGECHLGTNCRYVHGDICDMCGAAVLSPFSREQREQHTEECIKTHEKEMELAFAVQRSKDQVCGICMDIIWDKESPGARRFGILSACSHVFCLECIRKWRSAKQFENKIVRACPECRVKSDFVTPSKYWVDDKQDKQLLIGSYKQVLSKKACKYFDQGRGECPFNEKCFYLHAYPDGRIASPKPVRKRIRKNADGEVDVVGHLILWDVIQELSELRASRQTSASLLDGLLSSDLDDLIHQYALLGYSSSSDEEDE